MKDSLDDYLRFVGRLDEHCDSVSTRYAKDLACGSGCSACCHRQLSVFPIEAEAIRRWLVNQDGLAGFESDETRSLGHPRLLLAVEDESCALLDAAGRCRIYPVRPVICRTHGLPIAIKEDSGAVHGDCCPLNFLQGLDGLQSDDFLSLETVNTILTALNRAFVGDTGAACEERLELKELVSLTFSAE